MRRIGILSDTHGSFDKRLKVFFADCDELWHAGDIGSYALAEEIAAFKPLRAVYGNMDGGDTRIVYPKILQFRCEETDVLLTHIGGYPGRYEPDIFRLICKKPPQLFVSGHSHILKVMPDRHFNLLHINPGAAGNSGIHQVKTAVRLTIDGRDIKDLDIWRAERSRMPL